MAEDFDVPLFDMTPTTPAVPVALPEPMSAGRRLTLRQAADVKRGAHPLGLGILRHPETIGQDYSRDDKTGREFTCGSCRWREPGQANYATAGAYPKCMVRNGARVTHGPASDARAWWPACVDWEARS